MDNFARCFAFTLGAEGGYSDNAGDPGNWTGGAVGRGELKGTKFGVSASAYPHLDIINLTEPQAEDIYRRDYWATLQGDELPLPIAIVAFDAAVNAGPRRAVNWLQLAAGQPADGVLGPATLAALRRGDALLLAREALVRRLEFSTQLSTWPSFGLGWSRRIIALAGALTA
ncbi:MAG: glycosyl hydrolase 108 family protein [Acidocella sp.]|nr:glycosyl hydrolase 108 family protein [Acidocella sp.]